MLSFLLEEAVEFLFIALSWLFRLLNILIKIAFHSLEFWIPGGHSFHNKNPSQSTVQDHDKDQMEK